MNHPDALAELAAAVRHRNRILEVPCRSHDALPGEYCDEYDDSVCVERMQRERATRPARERKARRVREQTARALRRQQAMNIAARRERGANMHAAAVAAIHQAALRKEAS